VLAPAQRSGRSSSQGVGAGAGGELLLLPGHPEGRCFLHEGGCLIECEGRSVEQKYVWQPKKDTHSLLFRLDAAKPIGTWPTPNFKEVILDRPLDGHDRDSPDTETLVAEKAGRAEPLPTDPVERQKEILAIYTAETPLYHEMNRALRDDDYKQMLYYRSYIQELREVFKTDHVDQIITPFVGTVWRGIHYDDGEKALLDFKVKKEFVWPAFTSMTQDKNVAMSFGNVVFQIKCCPPEGTYEDDIPEYVPAPIKEFSVFEGESEVLFPPNVKFRVIAIQLPTEENGLTAPLVKCKTVGFDTDTGISQFAGADAQVDTKTAMQQHDDLIDEHDVKIDEIEDWVHQETDQMRNLSRTVTGVQGSMGDLRQQLEASLSRVSELEERLAAEERRRQQVEDKFGQLQNTVGALQGTVATLQLHLVQRSTGAFGMGPGPLHVAAPQPVPSGGGKPLAHPLQGNGSSRTQMPAGRGVGATYPMIWPLAP